MSEIMSEPEQKKTVNPVIAYAALAASILALFIGSRETKAPAVPPPQQPVVVEPVKTEAPPPVEQPKIPDFEPNKQGICFVECRRLGYTNGCYSGIACHCVKE